MSSYLEKQINFLKFDKRLLEINFKNGSITRNEYKKHLETLEDDVDRAEKLGLKSDQENKSQQKSMDNLSDSDPMDNTETEPETTEPDSPSSISNDPFGSGY